MKEMFVGILIFVIVMAGFFIGGYFIEKKYCLSAYDNFNPQYDFLWTGCRIMVDGILTPVDIVRKIE